MTKRITYATKCSGCQKLINARGRPNKSGLCTRCYYKKYAETYYLNSTKKKDENKK